MITYVSLSKGLTHVHPIHHNCSETAFSRGSGCRMLRGRVCAADRNSGGDCSWGRRWLLLHTRPRSEAGAGVVTSPRLTRCPRAREAAGGRGGEAILGRGEPQRQLELLVLGHGGRVVLAHLQRELHLLLLRHGVRGGRGRPPQRDGGWSAGGLGVEAQRPGAGGAGLVHQGQSEGGLHQLLRAAHADGALLLRLLDGEPRLLLLGYLQTIFGHLDHSPQILVIITVTVVYRHIISW